MTFFDIITINYNNAEGLKRTIKSINEQTYNCYRVILVDGNSNDSSADVIKKNCNNKFHIISEKDSGIYDAMNKGLKRVKSEFFLFLNSGDVFADQHLLQDYFNILKNNDLDILYSNIEFYNYKSKRVTRKWKASGFQRFKLFFGWMPPHPGFVISRKYYSLNKFLFDKNLSIAADYDFMLKHLLLIEKNFCRNLDRLSVRMEDGGISNKNFANIIRANLQVLKSWKKLGYNYPFWIFFLKPCLKLFQLSRSIT